MVEQPFKFTNTILAVNPPHFTNREAFFWNEVAKETERQGWNFLKLATFEIPMMRFGVTHTVSPILLHLKPMRDRLISRLNQQIKWFDNDYLDILEAWEFLRREIKDPNPDVRSCILGLAHWVDIAITTIRPALVLTCNKVDLHPALGYMAGKFYGCLTGVVERSPFDNIWYEPDGIFKESRLWNEYREVEGNSPGYLYDIGEKIVDYLNKNPYGFRRDQQGNRLKDFLSKKSKPPIFFLPMDNVLWTGWLPTGHPQGRVDYYYDETPKEALAYLAQCIRKLGGTLVIKRHPGCISITRDMIPDGAILYDADLKEMIPMADVIITFNTKVAFPAAAAGKPVVTLSPNPIAVCGCTYHCKEKENLEETLALAADRKNLKEKLEKFVPFAGWLETNYFYSYSNGPKFPQRKPGDLVKTLINASNNPEVLAKPDFQYGVWNLKYLSGANIAKPISNYTKEFITICEKTRQIPFSSFGQLESTLNKKRGVSLKEVGPLKRRKNLAGYLKDLHGKLIYSIISPFYSVVNRRRVRRMMRKIKSWFQ